MEELTIDEQQQKPTDVGFETAAIKPSGDAPMPELKLDDVGAGLIS